jgi:aspartate carbamoyltransferase catalytic subunit
MTEPRHLVSIDDLSLGEMEAIFLKAREISEDLTGWAHLCQGAITATLFYEPSTRTRLSFESATQRLGGGVITAADMRNSSASKGESLADTVRVVSSSYADILVLRHPSEGAARLAAEYSDVPVINAGDGSHEHPTQTLCDLYSLWVEHGHLEGLDVVLAGDLRYSRTIHSFAYALARWGANLVCIPQHGFELPDYVVKRLREEFGVEPIRANAKRLGDLAESSDVVYLTPQKPHQLSLFTDAKGKAQDIQHVHAVYMTRPQTERYASGGSDESTEYMQLGKNTMSAEPLKDAVVMHPLPRRDEISADFDSDPRGIYFKQAARGVPVRMALLGAFLGKIDVFDSEPKLLEELRIGEKDEVCCPRESCISRTEIRHADAKFKIISRVPLQTACAYCSNEISVGAVGCRTTEQWHAPTSPQLKKVRPEEMAFFEGPEAAAASGFQPAPEVNEASKEPAPPVL